MSMSMIISIKGKVIYQELGMGFWGIVGEDGREWLPVNLPSHLQIKDKVITVKAKVVEDGVSIFMWGTMVEII